MFKEKKDKNQNSNQIRKLQDFDQNKFKCSPKILVILVVVVSFRFLGFILSWQNKTSQFNFKGGILNLSSAPKGTIVGSNDTTTFKDTAEGTLKEGGIDGEGAFHLERPGGDSQNVYLTSSTVDLSKFVGKKIKVWGQTQKAQHAGWLMDVGRVEVL